MSFSIRQVRFAARQARLAAIHDRRRPSAGLTLMELVVVMAVLAAVAAIIVPLLPNLLRRAHKATDATQTSELAKAVQMYQAAYFTYPKDFDMLTAGGTTTTFPAYLPADGATFGGFAVPTTLTQTESEALDRVGITTVQRLAADATPSGFHPTLNPYPATTLATNRVTVKGNTSDMFAVIDPSTNTNLPAAFLATQRAADPTARYVVFGVGPRTSMIGTVIQDAPTSVPQKSGFTPANTYSRVGVIFKVSGKEVTSTERARFIGAVALEDDELEATDKDIIGYYDVSQVAGQ